jgi:hypothetical protein
MSEDAHEPHGTAAVSGEHVAAPIGPKASTEALKHSPRGALFVAGSAVALLLLGWLAFYFFLFLPRGPIG